MDQNPDSPFEYIDSATARAGIESFSRRLHGHAIGIVGLGGTGSYVLDLVSKTPVRSIHLFDDDVFEQHTAFRSPGAARGEDIARLRKKVDHFASIYSRMHRGIVPHPHKLKRGNLSLLDGLDFVFLCIDEMAGRRPIISRLESAGISFIDTGMGIDVSDDGILGLVRVSASTDRTREAARTTIPGGGGEIDDPYRSNIQIADLNALNASLAVLRWKRLLGFYRDGASEDQSVFVIDSNRILTSRTESV